MPKMSERDKLAELLQRQQKVNEEIEATRQRLRERLGRIAAEMPIETLGEREFRDVLGQVVRVGGPAALAALKPLAAAS